MTNTPSLERALELLNWLREDSEKLGAEDSHELMRAWENVQRMWQAEAHVRTILFRQETRWPGYYMRADMPTMDEENWKVFANCKYDPKTSEWEMIKRPIHEL
jgi:adenylylsulfate reductase, subunit A